MLRLSIFVFDTVIVPLEMFILHGNIFEIAAVRLVLERQRGVLLDVGRLGHDLLPVDAGEPLVLLDLFCAIRAQSIERRALEQSEDQVEAGASDAVGGHAQRA